MIAEINGQDRILVLGVNKALKDSGPIVERALSEDSFDVVLLSITDEEVEGLREFIKNPVEVEMDDVEIIYEYCMKKFGETSIPPEAYISAIKIADERNIDVFGIDVPSGNYEDIFVSNVQLSDMIFLSLRRRRLMKKRWNYMNPEAFISDWDLYLNKGGYRRVEKERARHMAAEVAIKKKSNTLAIIEMERFRDVLSNLNSILQGYKFQENVGETKAV